MRYKKFLDLNLSELGVGTYLGNPDEQTDKNYYETIKLALEKGVNVVDTAINYRNMRSERVIGNVLSEVGREKAVISTKGGYLAVPPDVSDATVWFRETLVKTGIVNPNDITETGNVLTKNYINWAFHKSLDNLKTDYIDVYYLHNPEDQLLKFSRDEFYKKLEDVFSLLEEFVKQGKLKYYGLATWNGFRVPSDNRQYLNLKEIKDIAEKVSGKDNHFKFIQLPYNIAMTEAYTLKNQNIDGKNFSTLEAAEKLGIYTYISAPLLQSRLIRPVAPEILQIFGVNKPSHIPIQFVRSTPGVGTVLIGTSKKHHLLENLEIENVPPLSREQIEALLRKGA